MNFLKSYTEYSRFQTRVVKVGQVLIGGSNPICIQSMTTKDAMDTSATVEECEKLVLAGCELIRISTPSKKEAENLRVIKEELNKKGIHVPLVADIHFTPNAAEISSEIVEKVRINPGNFADKKHFKKLEYTNESYQLELDRIAQKFIPFIASCKKNNTAIRIGVNHGSLSDRILSKYGDTPNGMVESALEFIRICEEQKFHDIILSMKASNPKVMVHAYRLLVAKMKEENMNYPLHLGVTEAGDGEDGRIKSAIGIGMLLEDGIGDTIRVSLTEAPEKEIPVAEKIIQHFDNQGSKATKQLSFKPKFYPFEYKKRKATKVDKCGGNQVPVVVANLSTNAVIKPSHLFAFGYEYKTKDDKWHIKESAVDYLYVGNNSIDFELPGTLGVIQDFTTWNLNGKHKKNHFPLKKASSLNPHNDKPSFIEVYVVDLEQIKSLKLNKNIILILKSNEANPYLSTRRFFFELIEQKINFPVIFNFSYDNITDEEQFIINASIDNGAPFIDGFGDGIMLNAEKIANQTVNRVAFGILQATRTRIYKTEYISCPSCGRTLFDLEEVTKKIRAKTHHLKGLKIGIMGCIVNGPGEMADADYGYVGSGKGKITLYKEKTVVKKAVDEKDAVDELIALIKQNGDWTDPNPEK